MVRVEFLGPIQREALEIEAHTLRDVADILNQDTELQEWIATSAVALNDMLVASLDIVLKDGDKISLLPPVCGG